MDRCPKCGCVTCGSSWTMIKSTGRIGILKESELCLRRQLAAANEMAGRLEKALEFYADTLKHNLMGEVNEDHGAIARKALEVPDA